ncbi:MAG: hypothetical protein LC772_03355 [Chloroflexi bacterium]|nr:hypothetical protein [Chloroflexota bacterium]
MSDQANGILHTGRRDAAELLRERSPLGYNPEEQRFSSFIQKKLYRLLGGEDNDLLLMRRHCGANASIAFLVPEKVKEWQVRPEIAERIITGVLRFLDPFAPGGPICQRIDDGRIIEIQTFPTHYPHIVVERVDVFSIFPAECLYIEWRAVRLQNQRRSTMVNRALDFGNLALELARLSGVPWTG